MADVSPHMHMPGRVWDCQDFHNGWLVVVDRNKIEPWSPDRAANRWRVVHMETLRTKDYPTLNAAKVSAKADGSSIQAYNHWWRL